MSMSGTLLREILKRPPLLIWALYLMAMPIYVGSSGLPQPSNVILVLLLPASLSGWDGRLDSNAVRSIRALLTFILWVTIINYSWAFAHWKWGINDYVLRPGYYVFNALMFFVVLVLARRFGVLFVRTTVLTLIISISAQVLASAVLVSAGPRGQLFFNNPNQLGYYALLSATLLAMTQRVAKFSRPLVASMLVGCAYLAILSASRAAVLGIGVLFLFLVFSNPRLIIAGGLLAGALVFVGGPISAAIDRAEYRAETRQREEFSEERGYDRLLRFKEHLLIGAGEGEFARFTRSGRAREIHSSIATIAFSYGVVGLALFVAFLWRVVGSARWRLMMMLLPTFAYAFAHQGMRFTMLWVVLATFMVIKRLPSMQSLPQEKGLVPGT